MRKVVPWISVVLAALAVPVTVYAWEGKVKECFDVAETQFELNRCAELDFETADKELNETYQAILKKHADDETFLARLRDAQRAWIAFRDTEMEARYPHAEDRVYGTVFPMCWSLTLADLTRQRTEQLRQWLVGVPEGEVCAGSLPLSDRSASEEP